MKNVLNTMYIIYIYIIYILTKIYQSVGKQRDVTEDGLNKMRIEVLRCVSLYFYWFCVLVYKYNMCQIKV